MSAEAVERFRASPIGRVLYSYLVPNAPQASVLLAVSGGPDSTALMHAATRVGATVPLHVATVDHGLRPGSGSEMREVGRAAQSLGLTHHGLAWTGGKPRHGIQAAARSARYALLTQCARDVGAAWILTGHTSDDQAETVLMRLLAGSGPAGLAGMRSERDLGPDVRLARPFLAIPKADLVAYCEAEGLVYRNDPSNADDRFARARLRRLLPDLEREGLSANRLCRLAERLARDEAALTDAARSALDALERGHARSGMPLVLDGPALLALPEAIVLRVVGIALDRKGGGGPARLERLERLVLDDLLPALRRRTPMRRTLRGMLVETTRDGDVAFGAAPPRRGGTRALRTGGTPCAGSLAAGPLDLLGKGDGSAYIGPECPE